MYLLFINDLYKDKYIIMRCKTVRLKTNIYVTAINALN